MSPHRVFIVTHEKASRMHTIAVQVLFYACAQYDVLFCVAKCTECLYWWSTLVIDIVKVQAGMGDPSSTRTITDDWPNHPGC